MVYTEVIDRKDRKYYYRVKSIKIDKSVKKERVYLGVNLKNEQLKRKEREADKK